jgi:hypothetical protein
VLTAEGWAYYDFSIGQSQENVCTHKHVTGRFLVSTNKEYTARTRIKAEVMYGILFTYPITSWEHEYTYGWDTKKQDFDVGLKGAFGDGPGWFFPIVTVSVEDQGSDQLNHEFFKKAVDKVLIDWYYYDYKEPE